MWSRPLTPDLPTLRAALSLHAGWVERIEHDDGGVHVTARADQGLEETLHGTPWRVDWRIGREVGVALRNRAPSNLS